MVHAAKSMSGRTEWRLEEGCLSEISPLSMKVSLSASDTCILKNLLCTFADEIDAAAEIELKRVRMVDRGIEVSRIATNDTVSSDEDEFA
jgi:hypothetical protein